METQNVNRSEHWQHECMKCEERKPDFGPKPQFSLADIVAAIPLFAESQNHTVLRGPKKGLLQQSSSNSGASLMLPATIIHKMNLRASAKYNTNIVKHSTSAWSFLLCKLC